VREAHSPGSASLLPRRGNLAEVVIDALSARMDSRAYAPGDKLPAEQELCREFGVSRTVVREAVASLRLGGRLYSRQGLGVFVAEPDATTLTFAVETVNGVRSALQILELRIGVESEAVALAAARRSSAALAHIAQTFDRLASIRPTDHEEEVKADYAFHLAIAQATNNPHFPHFLEALGGEIAFDLHLKHKQAMGTSRDAYLKKITREHGAILAAITRADPRAARAALRRHLDESLTRYRRLLSADG
jgi:DNA-binding FadR family transcriptional regulator